MCLGVPGKIVSVNGLVATVDFFGVQKQVNLHIVDEPVEARTIAAVGRVPPRATAVQKMNLVPAFRQ